jgi:8-oxo-dGTP pyrophosphatase MutT (NUDIX family)
MPIEKSAGAVIFRKEDDRIYYLLLYSPAFRGDKTHWSFPKGRVEKGESLENTAKREIEEETGIDDLKFLDGFKETMRYFFRWEGKNVMKFSTFFLAETKIKEVKISWEHEGYKWLEYKDAFEQLTFKNSKEFLKKANKFLLKNIG